MTKTPLSDLHYFLLDMDGTVYLGPKAIAGAREFIRFLRSTDRRFLFFTNNPTRDAAAYSDKLAGMGIETDPEDILTSGEATARYLANQTQFRRPYVVGTASLIAELERMGLRHTETEPDVVVLAFDTTLTYQKLERACLLLREGTPYIATNPDKVCPTDYGYIPDCGATAALLEAATGCTPKYIGKPNFEMVHMGLEKLGAERDATCMVGDRLYTDMEMAYHAGITSVLVLSGETREQDVKRALRQPDYVLPSVAELRAALEGDG